MNKEIFFTKQGILNFIQETFNLNQGILNIIEVYFINYPDILINPIVFF